MSVLIMTNLINCVQHKEKTFAVYQLAHPFQVILRREGLKASNRKYISRYPHFHLFSQLVGTICQLNVRCICSISLEDIMVCYVSVDELVYFGPGKSIHVSRDESPVIIPKKCWSRNWDSPAGWVFSGNPHIKIASSPCKSHQCETVKRAGTCLKVDKFSYNLLVK